MKELFHQLYLTAKMFMKMGWEAYTTDLGLGKYGKIFDTIGIVGIAIMLWKISPKIMRWITDQFSD